MRRGAGRKLPRAVWPLNAAAHRRRIEMRRILLSLLVIVAAVVLLTAAGIGQQQKNIFKGEVIAIDEESFTVEAETDEGDLVEKTFLITEKTKFFYEGEEVERDMLEEYDMVKVEYVEKGAELVAVSVTIEEEEYY
jgi:hypothetical protein